MSRTIAARGPRALALAAVAAQCLAMAPSAADAAPPVYAAQACCSVCPRAADPAVYTTPFLKLNRIQIEGLDGWLFRSEIDLTTELAPADPELYGDLARMLRGFKARGVTVLMYPTIPRGLVGVRRLKPADRARYDYASALRGYAAQLQSLRDAGFIVPDYTKFSDEPLDADAYYLRRDVHWRPAGAERTAQLIYDAIKGLGIDFGTPIDYTSSVIGISRHNGTHTLTVAQVCGGMFPAEVVPRYQTSAPNAGDLLGEERVPAITLAGSSMSANETYHFAGALQTLLKSDLLNVAISGGAMDGAITQYLMSDTYRDHPPKLLIWEVPNHDLLLTSHQVMRRLIPLVSGGCGKRKALLSNSVTMKFGDDASDVFYNGGDHPVSTPGRSLVVDLQFDNPNIKEIETEAWFLNGEHDLLRAHYNDFTNGNGRFVVEPSGGPLTADQPLVAYRVKVVTPIDQPTQLKAAVCASAP